MLLDVLADRLLLPVDRLFTNGEPDRLAAATMAVLRRNCVSLRVVEPWIARLAAAAGARASYDDRDPHLMSGNAEAYLRALYLQLALGPQPARGPLRPAAGARRRAARRPTPTTCQAAQLSLTATPATSPSP